MSIEEAACIATCGIAMFFAQAAEPMSSFPEWLQIGGVGAAVSVVVWYLYYTTAVILPKLQERHSATIEKIVDKHAGTVKDITDTVKTEMAEERKHHRETCAQIVDGIDRHISRLECQAIRRQQ